MASTIKLKNGSGAPLASDLVQAEPAFDLTNKRLYTEDSGGNVIEVGTNPSSLTIGGTALTATAAELNTLDGITATTAELNTLDGITATVTELNYTDGVTSNIQTQLDAKAPIASPTFTGTVTAPAVNVNGTVTADGLTVDGEGLIRDAGADAILTLQRTGSVTSGAKGAVGWKDSSSLYVASIQAATDGADNAASLYFRTDSDSTGNTGPYSVPLRMAIDSQGDISFYEDTGTTAKFFWDASAERLTIDGDDTASSLATAVTASVLELNGSSAGSAAAWHGSIEGGNQYIQASNGAGTTSYDMLINPYGGNVGIGTTSPTDLLNISGSSNQIGLDTGDQATYGTLDIGHFINGSFIGTQAGSNTASNVLRLGTSGTERMRIDSSGNLLVGTTDAAVGVGNTNTGSAFGGSTGYGCFSRTGAAAQATLYLNKNTNDGTIVAFNKNGTAVGSIGTFGGDLTLGTGITGIHFKDASDAIIPYNVSTGADRNGDIDLGLANNRFKDLYLSGGITSGANSGKITEIGGDTSLVQGAVGLRINDAASALSPTTASTNNDAAVDLGVSNIRFKNLYLSGGVIASGATSQVLIGSSTPVGGHSELLGIKSNGSSNYGMFISGDPDVSTVTAIRFYDNGATAGVRGSITFGASSTSYNTSSDYRLKENVVAMDNASDRVLALKPCRFNFIDDPDKTVDGFLAHEAQEVVPEAVTGSKDAMTTEEYEVSPAVLDEDGNVITEAVMGTREVPDYQGIDQSKLVPLLTKALQEALERIAVLESKVGA